MSLLSQFSWAAGSAIVLAASRFAFAVILARRVPQEIFGQYTYGQWIVDVSFLACSLGVAGAISRYVAEYENDATFLATIVHRWQFLAIGLPFVTAAAVLLGAHGSGISLTTEGFSLLAVWGIASGLWAMQTAALVGMRRFDLIFRANLGAGAIMLGGVFLLPSADEVGQIFALMATSCAFGASVGLFKTFQLSRGEKRSISRDQWKRMALYSMNFWIAALVAGLVWSRGEFPIVQMMLGELAIAEYAAAFAVFGAAIQGIMLATSGVAPHLTNLWGSGQKDEAIRLARDVMDLQLVLTALGTLFLINFGRQLISLAFTESYLGAADLLLILCLGLPGFVVASQSFLLQLETDARFNRNILFFGLVVLYCLALTLVGSFGLKGAAVARVGAMISIGYIIIHYSVRNWGPTVASRRNWFSVVVILSVSMGLSFAVSPDAYGLRFVLMVSAMLLSLFTIRNVAGEMAARSLATQLYTRLFPA
jgi:O-antigen/teichoic acid export membrane protein